MAPGHALTPAAWRGLLYVGPVSDRFSCQLLYLGYGTVLS